MKTVNLNMTIFKRLFYLSILGTVLLALLPGAGKSMAQPTFIGDEACSDCHTQIYESYRQSGHPFKLQKIEGKPPVYPSKTSPGVPSPPDGLNWSDISYVIGGFGWKARFMDKEGYILTGPENRQYNLPNRHLGTEAHWIGYDKKKGQRKPYTCGACHTTGWTPTGAQGPHQDNLPGIHGTWAQPGVTCEACHGPASYHVRKPTQFKLTTEERCGDCHKRGDATQIDAKNGLIKHHEQYEDLLASPHQMLKCSSCHEPHSSVIYGNGTSDNKGLKSIKDSCLLCHKQQTVKLNGSAHVNECTSCHMPRIGKSAVAIKHESVSGAVSEGDIRTHIFRINTNQDWNMFTDDGKFVRIDDSGKAYITLDRSCLSCHTDKTLEWAEENAKSVH